MAFEKKKKHSDRAIRVFKKLVRLLQKGGCLGSESIGQWIKQFRNPLLINTKQA